MRIGHLKAYSLHYCATRCQKARVFKNSRNIIRPIANCYVRNVSYVAKSSLFQCPRRSAVFQKYKSPRTLFPAQGEGLWKKINATMIHGCPFQALNVIISYYQTSERGFKLYYIQCTVVLAINIASH